jgi:hypothetical protein
MQDNLIDSIVDYSGDVFSQIRIPSLSWQYSFGLRSGVGWICGEEAKPENDISITKSPDFRFNVQPPTSSKNNLWWDSFLIRISIESGL